MVVIVWFAPSLTAQVSPPPDGGYPNDNTAEGTGALSFLTTGSANTAVGSSALQNITTANRNTAIGAFALIGPNNANGSDNTATGFNALSANTASDNTALGDSALFSNTSGGLNTALGRFALGSNSTGAGNTAVGPSAGQNLTTGNNNIDISNDGVAAEANTTRIGSVQTRAFIAGIRGTTTDVGDAVPVLIDSAGQLGTASSSRRAKRDIRPLRELQPLMELRPVSFRYRSGPPELHYGLIAEQVAKVLPELAVYGVDGRPETVQYQELPALLLAKIQDQQRQINRLKREVYGR